MKKFAHRILDSILTRHTYLIESVKPEEHFSQEVVDIISKTGLHRHKTSQKQSRIRCVIHQKRLYLITPELRIGHVIPEWHTIGLKRKYKYLREELVQCTFYYEKRHFEWAQAVIRDKESKKISFFNYHAGVKTVIWSSFKYFNREVTSYRYFKENGIKVLEFMDVDPNNFIVRQRIIDNAQLSTSLAPIDDQLLALAQKAATLQPIIPGKSSDLPIEIINLAGYADSMIRKLFWSHNNLAPYCLAHADVSPFNILRENGNVWLIDFDRSFLASAYYDFVYIWLNKYDRSTEKLRERIHNINAVQFGPDVIPEKWELNFALSLFVFDNIRYIQENTASIKDARFIIFLLNQLREKWPRDVDFVE